MARRKLVVGWLGGAVLAALGGGCLPCAASSVPSVQSVARGDWTLASGTGTTGRAGTYGTKGSPAGSSTPGGRELATACTRPDGVSWLFGGWGYGSSGSGLLGDLWRFDGTSWAWVSGSSAVGQPGSYGTLGVASGSNVPGARQDAVSWCDAAGNLYLFGGYGVVGASQGELNDLWRWDGTNWTWLSGANSLNQLGTYGTMGTASGSNVPGARYGAVGWSDASGNLWLFGGYGYGTGASQGHLNDLWKWNGSAWTWVSGSSTVNHAGSYGTKGAADPSNVPGGRKEMTGWKDVLGTFWLFGGYGYGSVAGATAPLSDLWRWDGTNWIWMSGPTVVGQPGVYGALGTASPSSVPGARQQAASWMGADGKARLFGGQGVDAVGANGFLSDLWEWDGTLWTWVAGWSTKDHVSAYGALGVASASQSPGGRTGPIAFPDAHGRAWLLGGLGFGASFSGWMNDLWRWDASGWAWMGGFTDANHAGTYGTLGSPAAFNEPGARHASSGWRSPGGDLWLFGGYGAGASGTGNLNDLWRWGVGGWSWMAGSSSVNQPGTYGTKGTPSASNVPGGRAQGAPWSDASGNFWLFGGSGYASSGSGYLNDLWRWDGTNWTWIGGSSATNQPGTYGTKGVPAGGNVPGARYTACSCSDAGGNGFVFGGYGYGSSSTGYLNDLWKWDGANWTWVSGASSPNSTGNYGFKGVAQSSNVPGGRSAAACWVDASGRFWLFGGYGYGPSALLGYLNDLWRWDGANWTWMGGSNGLNAVGSYGTAGTASATNVPGGRQSAAAVVDARGALWLFGGYGNVSGSYGSFNDLWKWDGTNWTWMSGSSSLNQAGTYVSQGIPSLLGAPGGRNMATSWADGDGNFWLFGGNGYGTSTAGDLSDLWAFGTCSTLPATVDTPNFACSGSSGNLASATAWPGASYAWAITNGTITSGAGTPSVVFSVGTSGMFGLAVVISSGPGCQTGGSGTMSILPKPSTPVVSRTSGSDPSCPGDPVTLDAGALYDAYAWSTGQTTRTIIVYPTSTATYTVAGTTGFCTSDEGSFTQTVVPATVVTSPSPADGSSGFTGGSLGWTAAGATSSDVLFDTIDPPQKVIAANTAAGTVPTPVWFPNTTYYWRVMTHAPCGTTASSVYSFTTGACAFTGAAPALVSPADAATGVPVATTLGWSALAGTSHYDLYIGTTNPPTQRYEAVYSPATSMDVHLAPDQTYFWQVKAVPVCGNGAPVASAVRTFTTPPGALTLSSVSPAFVNRWTGGSLSVLGTGFLATTTPFTDLDGSAAGTYSPGSWSATQIDGTLAASTSAPAGRYDAGVRDAGTEQGRLPRALVVRAFTDVAEGQFFFESSSRAADAGIMEADFDAGTAGPQFSPTTVVTRALMAEYLARSYQWLRTRSTALPPDGCVDNGAGGSSDFPDVPCSHPDWLAIHWIRTWGITAGATCPAGSGYTGLCYLPDTSITRGQMVTFLSRLKYGPEGTGTVLQGFLNAQGTLDPGCASAYPACSGWTDAGLQNVPTVWPHSYVNVAFQDRLTNGCSGTVPPFGFCTGSLITRGQMAEFLARTIGLVPTP